MHVRVAESNFRSRRLALVLFLAAAVAGAACAARPADEVTVSWRAASAPRVGDETVADVTLRDLARRPVRGARLQLQAFMSHPGMAPVVAAAEERTDGVYRASLRFTMAGPWTVVIQGSLPDGRTLTHRVDIPDVRAGG